MPALVSYFQAFKIFPRRWFIYLNSSLYFLKISPKRQTQNKRAKQRLHFFLSFKSKNFLNRIVC